MAKNLKKNVVLMLTTALVVGGGFMPSLETKAMQVGDSVSELAVGRSVNHASIVSNLQISSSGVATATASVTGKMGKTTKISLSAVLQKYNASSKSWSGVKTWTKSAEGKMSVGMVNDYQLKSSGKYRLKLTSKVWNKSDCESVVTYSTTKTY